MTARIAADLRRKKAEEKAGVVITMSCIEVALEQLEQTFSDQKPASRQLAKIRHWLEAVWKLLKADGKPLSAALLRRVDDEVEAMDAARAAVIGPCTTVPAWAAWLVSLDALLSDIRALWPEARKNAPWRYLCQTWDTWTRGFLVASKDSDTAEEKGFALFLRIIETTEVGYDIAA